MPLFDLHPSGLNRARRRLRYVFGADGKPIVEATGRPRLTHIAGLSGFAPARFPKAFRGCQSPRARARRAAKAAKLVAGG